MFISYTVLSNTLYWTCQVCKYKQYDGMPCYCPELELLRREWAANQNIATVETP